MTGMAVHMNRKMKKRTSAFAKGCNVVMGGTAVATLEDYEVYNELHYTSCIHIAKYEPRIHIAKFILAA